METIHPESMDFQYLTGTEGKPVHRSQFGTAENQQLACDPATSPVLLRKLAGSSDGILRQCVASNSNTPIDALQKLGAEFPEQVLANPIIPLLFLENHKILDELLPETILKNVAIDVDTPTEILGMLVHSAKVPIQEAARLHVNWQGEMSEGWDEKASQKLEAIAQIERSSSLTLEWLVKMGVLDDFLSYFFPNHAIADWGTAASTHPQFDVLEQLTHSDDVLVRICVAANPQTPAILLEALSQDPSRDVRRAVSRNPNTPLLVLTQLAQDDEHFIRQSLVFNPNISLEILTKLSKDESDFVRIFVALNPKASPEILAQLVNDKNSTVREYLLYNPNTPFWVVEKLAGEKLAKSDREFVARNPKIPLFILEQLAKHDDVEVLRHVAFNRRIPGTLLEQLAKDSRFEVRQAVALNWNTPVHVSEQLLGDPSCYYSTNYSNITHSILAMRYLERNPEGLSWVLENFAKYSPDLLARFLALLHPQTPAIALAQNCHAFEWIWRYAIAINPNTPPLTLSNLARDANRIVRAAAKVSLQQRKRSTTPAASVS